MSKRPQQKTWMSVKWNPQREVYQVSFRTTEEHFKALVSDLKKIELDQRSYNADTRVWSFAPAALDSVLAVGLRYCEDVMLIEGSVTKNVRTGETTKQLALFDLP